jgi:hypothetical protein
MRKAVGAQIDGIALSGSLSELDCSSLRLGCSLNFELSPKVSFSDYSLSY